jgi:5'-3' exonuclease
MGIYNFWGWFKNTFTGCINKLPEGHNLSSVNIKIDNLLIDMNGLFHNSTQKIYQYGNNKSKFETEKKIIPTNRLQIKVFEDICKTIENLFDVVEPKKRVVMCVDGTAPYAKQMQMRRRRFKSAIEREENDLTFDGNAISPGTKFMDFLSKYIDWFIRKKISEDPKWRHLEIIFSSEKVPSEGEHKLMSYVRKYGNKDESYCLQGLDADLIMLSLGTHQPNFYILRDDVYDIRNKFFVVNIDNVSLQLGEILRWKSETHNYEVENAIDDFVFLCFMAGNDFLPHIPSIEILESGIEIILSVYRDVGTNNGHIIKHDTTFDKKVLKVFFEAIAEHEKPILEKKLRNKGIYFQDELLEKHAIFNKEITLDIENYRTEYNEFCFGKGERHLKKICHDYLNGLQWVITYYKKGCSNWKYYYPYDYSPSASLLAKHIMTFWVSSYEKTQPFTLFQQLLSVLPPKSSNLLPEPLNTLLLDDKSPLKEYCPDKFEIDLAGKKREYQGIVKLPMMKPELIIKTYIDNVSLVNEREIKRNIIGKTISYTFDPISKSFNSYYGNIINCRTKIKIIFL